MRFCNHNPSNPVRLWRLRVVGMNGDPMRSGKNPGREFGGGRSDVQTAAAADDQRLKGRSNWLFPFPPPNDSTALGPCKGYFCGVSTLAEGWQRAWTSCNCLIETSV
jgi:hypothetical protein